MNYQPQQFGSNAPVYGQPTYNLPPQFGQPAYNQPGYNQPFNYQNNNERNPIMSNPVLPPSFDGNNNNGTLMDDKFPRKKIPDYIQFNQNVTCMNCNSQVGTIVTRNLRTSACVFACCICFICFPLFWVPFVLDNSYENVHTCPSCMTVLSYEL